jgi:hypothetical protein
MSQRNTIFAVAASLSVCLGASTASAGVTALTPSLVDNSAGSAELANFVTTDIKIDFTGEYTGAQAWIQLDSGSVYQHVNGSATPPNQDLVDIIPALGFDTFVANGSDHANGPFEEPLLGGGAVDLGAPVAPQFDTEGINQAWNTIEHPYDHSDFLFGRFTLSNDAQGTASFLASADGEVFTREFTIFNGFISHGDPSVEIMEIVLNDRELSEGPISQQLDDGPADPLATWSNLVLSDGNPAIAATLSSSGLFEWDPAGSLAGKKGNGVLYRWSATASNDVGSDSDFAISIRLIPEPATMSLFGLAMIACVGILRRRG